MGKRPRLNRGKDYEIVDGKLEFSRQYLVDMGGCCHQCCKNCPYEYERQERETLERQQPVVQLTHSPTLAR